MALLDEYSSLPKGHVRRDGRDLKKNPGEFVIDLDHRLMRNRGVCESFTYYNPWGVTPDTIWGKRSNPMALQEPDSSVISLALTIPGPRAGNGTTTLVFA